MADLGGPTIEIMVCPMHVLDFEHIQIQLQVHPVTAENVTPFLRSETERIKQRVAGKTIDVKTIVLIDSSCTAPVSAAVRQVWAKWINENLGLLQQVTAGLGVVVPNSLTRGTLTAITWMAPIPIPVELFGTMEQALDWAITSIDRAGGHIPSELLMGGAELVERRRARYTEQSTRPNQRALAVRPP